jgi:hypothetical protein
METMNVKDRPLILRTIMSIVPTATGVQQLP